MSRLARPLLVSGLVAALLSTLSLPASAGGAPLHFEQDFYVPGDTAVGHTTFGAGSVGLQGVQEGPYVAYLLGRNQWIDAPRVPKGAIRLGELRLTRDEFGFRASLSFVVPDVRSGSYVIGYCNEPCRVSQVGELWGGGISVYGSPDEARAARVVERAESRISALRSNLQVAQRKNRELASALRIMERARDVSFDRAKTLQAELDAARSAPEERPTSFALIGWLLFAATALLWVGRSLTRAQRRPPPDLPGIPERERIEPARELEPVS